MPVTTSFLGIENAPTGVKELDDLLQEVREVTGENWQVEIIRTTSGIGKFGFKTRYETNTRYTLLKFVDGTLPWQEIGIGSGDLRQCLAYLYGYISGIENERGKNMITLNEEAFDKLIGAIKNPPAATDALKELMNLGEGDSTTSQERVEKLEDLYRCAKRLRSTAVVDDDFPEVMHCFNAAIKRLED